MTVHRRGFLTLAGAMIAAPAVMRHALAQTQQDPQTQNDIRAALTRMPQVTFKLHHFLSPVANAHSRLLVPWARKIEKESGQRIRIELFPSMQLGGSPAQLFDQVRDGVVDIVFTPTGITPGRFPRIEVFELPFVADRRAVVNAQAVQALYEAQLRDEFADVHPLCLWAHDHGVLHTTRQVRSLTDVKGLKLRSPTRLASEALRALGADPVQMPLTLVTDAIRQKAIDGCVAPWEVVPRIKLQEAANFHTDFAASPTFSTATFVLAMNKLRYESLPADLKAVIDRNSGQAAAMMAGRMWDDQAAAALEMITARGNTLTPIDAADTVQWQKATQSVVERWLQSTKAINGETLLADAKALVAKYGSS